MRIVDNTAGVLGEVDKLIIKGLNEVAPIIRDKAKYIVVVITGRLQRNIIDEVVDNKAIIGSPLIYAPKIEMDKPFLRPALMQSKAAIKRIFKAK